MAYASLEDQRAWRRAHPEVSRRWRQNNTEQNRKIQLEDTARRRYGITREQQVELHSRPCEICGKKAKKMCIDHAGPAKVFNQTYRGVLCQQCNTRLGWFEKHQEIIVSYIKRGSICQQLVVLKE